MIVDLRFSAWAELLAGRLIGFEVIPGGGEADWEIVAVTAPGAEGPKRSSGSRDARLTPLLAPWFSLACCRSSRLARSFGFPRRFPRSLRFGSRSCSGRWPPRTVQLIPCRTSRTLPRQTAALGHAAIHPLILARFPRCLKHVHLQSQQPTIVCSRRVVERNPQCCKENREEGALQHRSPGLRP